MEIIFIIVLGAVLAAYLVYVVISFGKKKLKVITDAKEKGLVTDSDIFLKGTFFVNMGQTVKKAVIGVNTRGKQVVAALNNERMLVWVEHSGALVNGFNLELELDRKAIDKITVKKHTNKWMQIEVGGENNKFILVVWPLYKNETLEPALKMIEEYYK
jgi:pyrimidine operon attenuation protein/uracil phosphoribosyltransferase